MLPATVPFCQPLSDTVICVLVLYFPRSHYKTPWIQGKDPLPQQTHVFCLRCVCLNFSRNRAPRSVITCVCWLGVYLDPYKSFLKLKYIFCDHSLQSQQSTEAYTYGWTADTVLEQFFWRLTFTKLLTRAIPVTPCN